jgi:proline-specific peptidase
VSINFKMAYYVHNPKHLASSKRPIIFLHGGPGIPHHYLKPILNHVKDRSVIFYDQIGCGSSSEPSDINAYSINFAVDDLRKLVRHLNLHQFHLCGHSFGGIVAFEFAKRFASVERDMTSKTTPYTGCLSLTLSSTPFNVHEVDEDSERILHDMQNDLSGTDASSLFHRTFMCRTEKIPSDLEKAFSMRGKVWQGTDVIQKYVASGPLDTLSPMPPVLLLRGEFDFVSKAHSLDSWKALFDQAGTAGPCKMFSVRGCSHYGMLEDGALYSDALVDFLSEIEPKTCEQ